MIQAPNTYTVQQVVHMAEHGPMTEVAPNNWVTVRPLGFSGLVLGKRLKAAWRVFTGRSDELIWEQNKKTPPRVPPTQERTARTRVTDPKPNLVYHMGLRG
jgi:hypothetical protein